MRAVEGETSEGSGGRDKPVEGRLHFMHCQRVYTLIGMSLFTI